METGNVGNLDIQVSSSGAQTAPAGIFLEAINITGFGLDSAPAAGVTYDRAYHEIHYTWTVKGEPALPPFTRPENLLRYWNKPNIAYGKKVAFHFPEPGTYQIEVEAIGPANNRGTASRTVTVLDADDFYPGTQTVCFSSAGDETWAGEMPGCQRARSFSQLQQAINSASSPLRILFKRGQTVTQSQMTGLLANNSGEWLNHVGAWSTGAKPIIECPSNRVVFRILGPSSPVAHFTCENIDFRGEWDAQYQVGKPGMSPFSFNTNRNDCFYTISQCDFTGLSSIILSTDNDHYSAVLVADCNITNWQDYGIYIANGHSKFAVIGSRLVQHMDAGNGHSFGKNWMFNQHGPLRVASSELIYITMSDFFSRCGWSKLAPDQADQPCMRLHQSGLSDSYTNIDRVVCEGGGKQIALSTESRGFVENPGNHLIDKALLLASPKTWEAFVLAEYGGTTIRNVLGIQLDVPDYHTGNGWQGAVKLRAQNPAEGNLDGPMHIYNNSWINLRSSSNDPSDNWGSVNDTTGFRNVTDENNVTYAPNMDSPVNAGLPLSLSEAITDVSPRYRGVQYYPDAWTAEISGGNVANGGSVSFPYPPSTNQAFWLSRAASDTLDVFRDGTAIGGTNYHAEDNEIKVTFHGTSITVTNMSGATWTRTTKQLKLDRKSSLPALPATFSQEGVSLRVPRPTSTIGNGLGLMAHDDFEGRKRQNPTAGAFSL